MSFVAKFITPFEGLGYRTIVNNTPHGLTAVVVNSCDSNLLGKECFFIKTVVFGGREFIEVRFGAYRKNVFGVVVFENDTPNRFGKIRLLFRPTQQYTDLFFECGITVFNHGSLDIFVQMCVNEEIVANFNDDDAESKNDDA